MTTPFALKLLKANSKFEEGDPSTDDQYTYLGNDDYTVQCAGPKVFIVNISGTDEEGFYVRSVAREKNLFDALTLCRDLAAETLKG